MFNNYVGDYDITGNGVKIFLGESNYEKIFGYYN
ncbi:hypothetical protein SDC9_121652 [bioreactor metagenome]|uniref:Uncharacterized protein n=1 Tax=bioreactor metagenome TaxID=1076179 RepID=A0A645CCL6_9ZZZZ